MIRTWIVLLGALAMSGGLRADVWVQSSSGFWVMTEDENGNPITTPAPNVTGYVYTGTADPTNPQPPQPPPPGGDRWGLIKVSREAANSVSDDPKRAETAAKIGAAYTAIGGMVKSGQIKRDQLKITLALSYSAAVGSAADAWQSWRTATDEAYNTAFGPSSKAPAADAGQGLIDIGTGVTQSGGSSVVGEQIASDFASDLFRVFTQAWALPEFANDFAAAIGDGTFLKFLIEVLIPLILEIIKLLNPPEPPQPPTNPVGLEASASPILETLEG